MMDVVDDAAQDEASVVAGTVGTTDASSVLAALFEREYRSLVGLARVLVDDQRDAEEVVQEAFTRVFAAWERVNSKSDPLSYVRRSVVNLARGRLRRRGVARRTRTPIIDPAPAAEDEMIGDARKAEVLDAIRALPTRQRECIALRYFLDCSTDEAAAILGVSSGSVKTHLHRALKAMEVALKEEP
jgi:RNA polymerase sigma-70 factor (sigma-E family)